VLENKKMHQPKKRIAKETQEKILKAAAKASYQL
jgi:hypothetical protein